MRQLIFNDAFKMSRILKKIDIDFNAKGGTDEEIALGFLMQVLENIHLAQTEVNDFLGGLTDMTGEEFGNLSVKKSMEVFQEFKELDGIADFFKLVGRLTK